LCISEYVEVAAERLLLTPFEARGGINDLGPDVVEGDEKGDPIAGGLACSAQPQAFIFSRYSADSDLSAAAKFPRVVRIVGQGKRSRVVTAPSSGCGSRGGQ
jgi:hypothetical protein